MQKEILLAVVRPMKWSLQCTDDQWESSTHFLPGWWWTGQPAHHSQAHSSLSGWTHTPLHVLRTTSSQSNLAKAASNLWGKLGHPFHTIMFRGRLHPKLDLNPYSRFCSFQARYTITEYILGSTSVPSALPVHTTARCTNLHFTLHNRQTADRNTML